MQPVNYYCEEYPVVNYTVELTNVLSSEAWLFSVLAEDSITVNSLPEDTIYIFELIAVNDFGAVSSGNRTICMLTSVYNQIIICNYPL